jgi:hypothetical protein
LKTFIILLLTSVYLFPQCSDAGICSIGGPQGDEIRDYSISLSYQYGYSGKDDDISYNSVLLNAKYYYSGSSFLLLSLPYNSQSGPLGSVSGIGDLIILGSQNIYSTESLSLSVQAGAKLATAKVDADDLPQNYQSGLGSNDILLGVSGEYKNLYSSLGYQIAGRRNDNIQQVERGDDFLYSAGYSHGLTTQLKGALEFLIIKRIGETSIVDPASPGNYINISESDNLQINGAVNLSYIISENFDINLFGAVPFRKRPVNIDGLTRSLSLAAGVSWRF